MKSALLVAVITLGFSIQASARPGRFSDPTAEMKVDQVVSIFENETPELQYDYIEKLKDDRGYTAGRAGFTTATGDLVDVIHHYADMQPTITEWPQLQNLIPRLEQLAADVSGSIRGIEALPALWEAAADDPKFRAAQDDVTEIEYKTPAREKCARLNLKSALSFLIIFDSIIQHGDGDDMDSIEALISRTHANSNTEESFIRAFLDVRRADLMNPYNKDTTDEWRESVDRVDALKRVVDTGNWDLSSPLRIDVFGKPYAL